MPYSNTDQENGFLKLLNVPLKQFQPLVKQCTEVLYYNFILFKNSCYQKSGQLPNTGILFQHLHWNM